MQSRLLYKIGIAIVLCACVSQSYGQWEPAMFFNVGYGSYSAGDMKAQNKSVQKVYPEMKIVSNYPAWFNYSGGISMLINKTLYVTAFGGHSSTGSRVSYGDYSGHIYQDNLVRTSILGISGSGAIAKKKGFAVFFGLRCTANFNKLKIIYELQTGSDFDRQDTSFDAITLGFEPHLTFYKPVKRFVGRLELGYEGQISGQWHLPGNKNAVLIDTTSGDKLRYNATGLRLNAGISFLLNPPAKEQE